MTVKEFAEMLQPDEFITVRSETRYLFSGSAEKIESSRAWWADSPVTGISISHSETAATIITI